MKILIVYDSYYGNTLKVAKQYHENLIKYKPELIKVDVITQCIVDSYDLIIIGTPTRIFSMTGKIKRMLRKLKFSDKYYFVFDTRANAEKVQQKFLLKMINKFGYAAEKVEALLNKKAAKIIMDYKWYFVKDSEGPLEEDSLVNANNDCLNLIKKLEELN
ncbi:MAG: hypothetical protein KAU02_05125 [Tenericutes bacterium]|nr:hypothetical protein [Mycoplasmatota bacterium]